MKNMESFIGIRIATNVKAKLASKAADEGLSLSSYVRIVLRNLAAATKVVRKKVKGGK